MRRITDVGVCSSKGILPVKTSTANIPKANTSAAFDSVTMLFLLWAGVMISGASHLEVPTVPGAAATVKLGSELMGANPYSVNRARPLRSMTTFAYSRGISMIARPGTTWEGGDSALRLQRSKCKQEDDIPPSNLHAGYQMNEGIPVPSRHQIATVRKKVSNLL